MMRNLTLTLAFAITAAGMPVLAAGTDAAAPTSVATPAAEAAVPAKKLGCAAPDESAAAASAAVPANSSEHATTQAQDGAPKVVFQLNTADDAPTILRFVTNYLAVEPTAHVAVVGYAGGIDFMLLGARDSNGKLYADQMAALSARGVAFKVCNNTLKARNLTAAAVSPPAIVVPGAVNEIIRLQTREGYAYFQN